MGKLSKEDAELQRPRKLLQSTQLWITGLSMGRKWEAEYSEKWSQVCQLCH